MDQHRQGLWDQPGLAMPDETAQDRNGGDGFDLEKNRRSRLWLAQQSRHCIDGQIRPVG